MKRSRSIYLAILPAIALIACDDHPPQSPNEEVKHCVDETGTVVEDNNCDIDAGTASSEDAGIPDISDASTPNHSSPYRFRWYYGGHTVYSPGTIIHVGNGGSYTPNIGRSYSSPTTISRGGFGGTGRGIGAAS